LSGVASGGAGSKIPSLLKSFADQDKATADLEKTRTDSTAKKLDIAGQAFGYVRNNPTLENAHFALDYLGSNGIYTPEQVAQYKELTKSNPAAVKQLADQAFQAVLSAKDQLPTYQTRNTGGTTDTLAIDPVTRKVVVANSVQNTQSPDSKASSALGWANNKLSRERLDMEKSAPKGQIIQTDQGTMIVDPRSGTAQPVTGPGGKPLVGAGKAPTEFQGKSAAFGARADLADKTITGLTGKYSPVAINSKMAVESTPLIGGIIGAATNKMALSQNDQKAEQAQRDFVNAILRQESGAVISDTEFDNARKQYFPQPGDGSEVIAQKAKNRKTAIEGLKRNAGSAAFTPSDADAGGLSPAEQKELDQLRARFGKK
jgi:hypothetical protein